MCRAKSTDHHNLPICRTYSLTRFAKCWSVLYRQYKYVATAISKVAPGLSVFSAQRNSIRLPMSSIYAGYKRASLIKDATVLSLEIAFLTSLNPLYIIYLDWKLVLSISLKKSSSSIVDPVSPVLTHASISRRDIKHTVYHFASKTPFAQDPYVVHILTFHT